MEELIKKLEDLEKRSLTNSQSIDSLTKQNKELKSRIYELEKTIKNYVNNGLIG